MNTKLFEQVHYFGTPWKDLFAQVSLASVGFSLTGSSPTMSAMFPEPSLPFLQLSTSASVLAASGAPKSETQTCSTAGQSRVQTLEKN